MFENNNWPIDVCVYSGVRHTKLIDSGGGFLIEKEIIPETNGTNDEAALAERAVAAIDDVMELPPTYEKCLECDDSFTDSYLMTNFAHSVCDKCRDSNERHSLITRTEAKNEYLLKDCDLDRREPPLKYIERQNPHNQRWGTMKLYLHLLVEKRALEVWGSEERLMEELALRDEKRDKAKHKKYNKNMKQLRMEMRSSLFDGRTAKGPHTHEYGEETYNEDDDNYSHTCTVCDFVETFEKMWNEVSSRIV